MKLKDVVWLGQIWKDGNANKQAGKTVFLAFLERWVNFKIEVAQRLNETVGVFETA